MDIYTLAGDVVSILTPFLPYLIKSVVVGGEKAVEKFGEEVGSGLAKGVKNLWDKLPDKNGKKSSLEKKIRERPDQQVNTDESKEIQLWLEDALQKDPHLTEEIENLRNQLEMQTVVHISNYNTWQLSAGEIKINDRAKLQQALRQLQIINKTIQGKNLPIGVHLLEELMQNQLAWLDIGYKPDFVAPLQKEFYDRSKIMELIRYENQSSRVIELTGPSGIGKTHLFDALTGEEDRKLNDIPQATWGVWRYARVDCREKTTYAAIMEEWTKCLGDVQYSGSPIRDLAYCLMGQKMQANQAEKIRILFILDHADGLSDEVLVQLIGEEGPVSDRISNSIRGKKGMFFLRLVLATRRQRLNQDFTQRYKLQGILPQAIDPLDANTISLMLKDRYRDDFGDEFTEADDFVKLLLDVTGGQPKAICEALNELRRRRYSGDLDGDLKDVIWKITQYIAKQDILGELSLQDYYLLNVLSFYRRFAVPLISQLVVNGVLPVNILPNINTNTSNKQISLVKAISHFTERTGLISRNVIYSFFQVHPVLQPVLQNDLERKQSAVQSDIHKGAFNIYYQYLIKRDGSGQLSMNGDQRVTVTLEAIYHFVKWNYYQATACEAIVTLVKELIELDRESVQQNQENIMDNPDKLKLLWRDDLSLHVLLRDLAKKCPDIFETLNGMFNALS